MERDRRKKWLIDFTRTIEQGHGGLLSDDPGRYHWPLQTRRSYRWSSNEIQEACITFLPFSPRYSLRFHLEVSKSWDVSKECASSWFVMSTRLGLSNQSERTLRRRISWPRCLHLSFSPYLCFFAPARSRSPSRQIAATASGEFDDTVIDEHPIAEFRPWKMEVPTPSVIGTNPSSLYEAVLALTKARWSSYAAWYQMLCESSKHFERNSTLKRPLVDQFDSFRFSYRIRMHICKGIFKRPEVPVSRDYIPVILLSNNS